MSTNTPTFNYLPLNSNCILDQQTCDLLSDIDAFTNSILFSSRICAPIELPDSLGDIHNNLLANVIVSDEKFSYRIRITANKRIKRLKELLEKLKCLREKKDDRNPFDIPLDEEIKDPMCDGEEEIDFPQDDNQDSIDDAIGKLEKEISDLEDIYKDQPDKIITISYPLLGKYVYHNPNQLPEVYLYINNIKHACKNNPNDIPKLFATTYVHEMMHAYYNAATLCDKPYYRNMEEALAEFGMLTFLRDFRKPGLLQYAFNNVRAEINSPSLCYYGFGSNLFKIAYPNNRKIKSTLPWLTRLLPVAFRCNNLKLNDKSDSFILCNDILENYEKLQAYSRQALQSMMEALYDSSGANHLKNMIKSNHSHLDMVVMECVLAYRSNKSIKKATICCGVKKIIDYCFAECLNLRSVVIPDSVTEIGDYAFDDCSDLTSIHIPDSVTVIGKQAFDNCSDLTSINIPNSVTKIGNYAFDHCSDLTSIHIPDSVTKIGDYAFIRCHNLIDITVAPGNVFYDSRSNCNALIETSTNKLLNGCTNTIIPGSVTEIGDFAFYGCKGLTSINIPNSVTEIGDFAFYGCKGLTSINIPNSVTEIGDSAFMDCTGLTRINIPNSVTEIGYQTFYGCTGLKNITIPNSVTKIGNYAFKGCTGLTISIPATTTVGTDAFKGCAKEIRK